ncbi:MAG: GNAT family N-acetyltransferase [Lachnospiraceae bacterium]|nr:GNAT family N-acetyltransferase [Lachnospiraceae bacterium]
MKQIKDKEYEGYQQYLYNKAHGYIWTPDTLELICNGNDGDPEQIGKQIIGMADRLRNEHVSHRLSDTHKSYVIRLLRKSETELLKDFLYEAIFIPTGMKPPARDIIEKPELRVYTEDFGTRKGDNCLVADFRGKVVGVVWTRIMNDYGHVDDETPSFAISLYREYRGQGIGSQMMMRMLELLKWQGYERASLAVQKTNYAVKMYKNVGFKTVDENTEEYIMVCEL